ncbi:hypothetical protein G6N76_23230 [Rhizobium daejeonense]|uniref:Uncharacterized protein n=1 Tax=Rhizobium daejeonense TaxID=240521 RepID=A0A6M1RXM4_9HYPH|nr:MULTISPECIES: hypothetical protein [Rhizobiaceae]NGO66584.1 hypothetical protein [Rhizobium daejeonense]QRI66783.1 hypothetical protein JQ506_26940 [Shinella sp. PSBB067]
MAKRKITIIDGGSAEYWRQRTEGFRLIREAEEAAERLASAPMYLHGGYDENGDVIAIENLRPDDEFDEAIRAVVANETAFSILVAQERTRIGNRLVKEVVAELEQMDDDLVEHRLGDTLWETDTD